MLMGLSVDSVGSPLKWKVDIGGTQGAKVNQPMIGDAVLALAKLHKIRPAEEQGTSDGRTAATNASVRSVFTVGPDKEIKLMPTYPMTAARSFDEILRVLDSMQASAQFKVVTPWNGPLGEDVINPGSVGNAEAKVLFPAGWVAPNPRLRIVPQLGAIEV